MAPRPYAAPKPLSMSLLTDIMHGLRRMDSIYRGARVSRRSGPTDQNEFCGAFVQQGNPPHPNG